MTYAEANAQADARVDGIDPAGKEAATAMPQLTVSATGTTHRHPNGMQEISACRLHPIDSDLIDMTDPNEPDIPCYESDSTSTSFEGF